MRRCLGIVVAGSAALTVFTFGARARAEQPPAWNCYDDGDCLDPDEPYCDIETGSCHACLVDEHCDADFLCHQNFCIPQCFSDADCDAPESYCSGEGLCFECLDDTHCAGDEPLCLVEDESAACVECIVDDDCAEPDPFCKWNNSCVGCLEHVDCPEEQHCSQDACAPDVCVPGTLSCTDNGFWVQQCDEYGASEQAVEQCPNADCEDGACGGPPDTDTDSTGDTDTDTDSDGSEDPGSEGSADSGDSMEESGEAGATPSLEGRGCSCGVEDEGTPAGGLGLLVFALLGLRRRAYAKELA